MNEEFFEIYEEFLEYKKLDDTVLDKIYLNDSSEIRLCRFCVEDKEKLKFSKVAHAISEGVGNKRLISNYECDICNEKFGKKFEDDFCKYIHPFRMVSGVYGKKSYLKHKNEKEGHRIERRKNTPVLPEFDENVKMLLQEKRGDQSVKINEETGEMTILFKRQKYKPQNVYKAMVKMALSIMPKEEISNFIYTIAGLKVTIEEIEDVKMPDVGILEFVPGSNPLDGTNVKMYKRKNSVDNIYPYIVFKLCFGNFSLQIPVLKDSESEGNKKMKYHRSFENSDIRPVDFTKAEEEFSCIFNGIPIELNEDEKSKLENVLKDKGYLKR